mgnify:CR=1 FL=1
MDQQLLKDIQTKGKKFTKKHYQKNWRKMNEDKVKTYNKKSNIRRSQRIKEELIQSMEREKLI